MSNKFINQCINTGLFILKSSMLELGLNVWKLETFLFWHQFCPPLFNELQTFFDNCRRKQNNSMKLKTIINRNFSYLFPCIFNHLWTSVSSTLLASVPVPFILEVYSNLFWSLIWQEIYNQCVCNIFVHVMERDPPIFGPSPPSHFYTAAYFVCWKWPSSFSKKFGVIRNKNLFHYLCANLVFQVFFRYGRSSGTVYWRFQELLFLSK